MILGKKIGMTQIFENEKLIPVTVIEAGPNFVVQKKSEEKDGYNAITLAYDDKREKNTIKPEMGIFKKAGISPKKFLKEFKVAELESFELGQEFKVDVLEGIEFVDIVGTSKGKETEQLTGFPETIDWEDQTPGELHQTVMYLKVKKWQEDLETNR